MASVSIKQYAWLSDTHFSHLTPAQFSSLAAEVASTHSDFAIVTGDISEAADLENYLTEFQLRIGIPIYFVLGNHDFYGSSFDKVRASVRRLVDASGGNLVYLHDSSAVAGDTTIVGADGWGDGLNGRGSKSQFVLSDFTAIEDLRGAYLAHAMCDYSDPATRGANNPLYRMLATQGRFSAEKLIRTLPLVTTDNILIATHVPPFVEAALYQNKMSDSNAAPHFTCKQTGEVIRKFATEHPEKNIEVICGHTHHHADVKLLPNLHVKTAQAEYHETRFTVCELPG